MPYIYLYNQLVYNDDSKSEGIKQIFTSKYSLYFNIDRGLSSELFDEYISDLMDQITVFIEDTISQETSIVCFTSKFYQWIPASIFAYLIKKKYPHITTIIGGWTNKYAARSILSSNNIFDYSIWGEGEIPLYYLYQFLNQQQDIKDVPRIVYRNDYDEVCHTQLTGKSTYIDLNDVNYLKLYDHSEIYKNSVIPLEKSRGCSWNKCKFCFLSEGYYNRVKTNEVFIDEIKYYINKYNIYKFMVVDNDFIGSDINLFIELLQSLAMLKKEHQDFAITMCEIITINLDKDILKLMLNAGIERVQIGIESLSVTLLDEMNKKQSLADNFFFIKNAVELNIYVAGNIIVGIPSEDDSSVIENINSLYYLRFILSQKYFVLSSVNLSIGYNSYYYRQIKKQNNLDLYSRSDIVTHLSDKQTARVDKSSTFEFSSNQKENVLWESFNELLNHYKKHKYSYKIYYKPNSIIYKEYCDRKLIKEIMIDDNLTFFLLIDLNSKIVIKAEFINKYKSLFDSLENKFDSVLMNLQAEGLIFCHKEQIVSLISIDVDKIPLNKATH
jgi:radical SAM superfamily enzyme YgiQ (UPF0313 family)